VSGATIRQIVTAAQTVVGEIAGPGVQLYAEDRQLQDCIRAFNLTFKKRFWEVYTKWVQVTLDGTTGVITTDTLKNVRDVEDFARIMRDGERNPIPLLPSALNPYTIPSGSRPLYWGMLHVDDADFLTKRIKFYPADATGSVNIQARFYPKDQMDADAVSEWDWEDTMYFDMDLLVYGTAFFTLSHDDINATAADVARSMMEARYRDITTGLASHPIATNASESYPTQWWQS
jgi:hypothetical protein